MLEAYLLKIRRAMPRALSSFFALIKCARAIFQTSDRSQTLYTTVCITSWTECNFIQLYCYIDDDDDDAVCSRVQYAAAIQK